jgi:hypothetical protein
MHAFGGSFKSLMFVDPAFPNNTELEDMLKDGKIDNKYNSARLPDFLGMGAWLKQATGQNRVTEPRFKHEIGCALSHRAA